MKSTVAHSRLDLLKALEQRYASNGPLNWQSLRGRWKRAAWFSAITFARLLKRLMDILGASTGLLLLSPLLVLVALAIWLHDRGPVFFVQKRVGQWGREFDFPKFRSMVNNAEALKAQLIAQNHHKEGVTFKIQRDPRVTPIGRWLRKTSIDELPQLFNVLKSDMSLVGPRPIVQDELQKYGLEKSYYLMVRPGMTGLWQVSGRNDVDYETRVYLDAWYVKNWSLWYDLAILFKTIKVVFWRNGAY